jgi:hypothetical protein
MIRLLHGQTMPNPWIPPFPVKWQGSDAKSDGSMQNAVSGYANRDENRRPPCMVQGGLC